MAQNLPSPESAHPSSRVTPAVRLFPSLCLPRLWGRGRGRVCLGVKSKNIQHTEGA